MINPKKSNIPPLAKTKSKTYTSSTGEELTTVEEDKSYQLAKNFSKVGSFFNQSNSMNILKLARNMTKKEIDFLITLFDSAGNNYKAYTFDYDMSSSFSHSQKNAVYTAFNLLHSKLIVKRVSKAKYIINPELFIPFEEELADKLWASLP